MFNRRNIIVGWVALLALYLATAARYLTHADSPEFVALAELGGVAHPPGYPVPVLIYRAFAWLPVDPRVATGVVTAVVGAAAMAALFRACRAWGVNARNASIATVFVALNSQVWLVHTHPEAFAFNNLFAALILWFAAPGGPLRGAGRVATLGGLAGLALCAHHSAVLLTPIGLWGAWRGVREAQAPVVAAVAGVGALAAGLVPYGYLLVAESSVSFGVVSDVSDLLAHFLRQDYGTAQLGAQGEPAPFQQLGFWLSETFAASMGVGLLAILAGVAAVVQSDDEHHGRRLLVATWLLSGPLFVLLFNVEPVGPQTEVVKRFHVLPFVVAAPLIAWGVDRLGTLDISARLLRAAAIGSVALMLLAGLYRTHQVYDTSIEDYLRNTLATMPRNAVVVGQGDHRYFGYQYLQEVEGLRPDVVVVEPMMLGFDWATARLSRRLDVPVPPPEVVNGVKRADLRAFLDQVLATDRPLFVTNDFNEDVLAEFERVPHGLGWRVLRPGEPTPSASTIFEQNRRIYDELQHRSSPPEYLWNPWGWSLFNLQTRVWQEIVERCEADSGASCAPAAREYLARYPDL